MRHFLFEEKEYRINPQFKRKRNEQDSALALARLLRRKDRHSRGSSGGGGSRRSRNVDTRQKCVVKMQYSSSIEAHRFQLDDYLVREGKGIDGGQPELYGTDLDEYRSNMAERNFRIFLSPQSDKIDLKDLTEKFVARLEAVTGYKLYWQGANHYDTAHPHAHLLINGRDKNGKEVTMPRDIVKTFMREYARDICTEQIGHRTRAELELEKERELEARRYTKTDEQIKDLCSGGGGGTFRVNLAGFVKDKARILTRLENLRKMNLCVYKNGGYELSPRWEDDLRANARYNTFLRAREELESTSPSNLKIFSGEHGTVTGKVTKIYRPEDDFSNNHAVIIESPDGNAYFVPLLKNPEMYVGKGQKARLAEGEQITMKTYENQKGRMTPLIFKKENRTKGWNKP